jgi:hypothetical protein
VTGVLIVQLVVISVLSLILGFIIGPLVIVGSSDKSSQTALTYAITAFVPTVLVMVGVSLGFFIWSWRRLNQNYGFTQLRGCAALILSSIMISAIGFVFNAIVLGISLNNMNTPRF